MFVPAYYIILAEQTAMKTKYTYALIPFIFSSSLFAADLSAIKPIESTNRKSIWEGMYLGINAGIGGGNYWSNQIATHDISGYKMFNAVTPSDTGIGAANFTNSGIAGPIAGIQAGYNFYLNNNLVIGSQLDFDWANIFNKSITNSHNSFVSLINNVNSINQYNQSLGLSWVGTARGRIGFSIGRFLPYITAGLAYGNVKSKVDSYTNFAIAFTPPNNSFNTVAFSNDTRNSSKSSIGWVSGLGTEYLLTQKLSLKSEYIYTQLSGVNYSGYSYNLNNPINNSPNTLTKTNSSTGTVGTHQIRLGLNYLINTSNKSSEYLNNDQPILTYYDNSYSWDGFYFGLNGAYGTGNVSSYKETQSISAFGPNRNISTGYSYMGGGLAGTQIGFNKTFAEQYIAGVETDIAWSGLQVAASYSGIGINRNSGLSLLDYSNGNSRLQWYGSSRLRFGYKLNNILPYVTGGIAYGVTSIHDDQFYAGSGLQQYNLGPHSYLNSGWVIGSGLEYKVTETLSMKSEYLYTKFGGQFAVHTIGGDTGYVGPYAGISKENGNLEFHQVRVGLNYHFNASEEKVVAKY